MSNITFIGGASRVTGSLSILNIQGLSLMIDCGAEQEQGVTSSGYVEKIDATPSVDYCLITHAHFDHCGLIPLAFKKGRIRKCVISTPATKALAEIILLDSARIQAESQDMPIYNEEDIKKVLSLWETKDDGIPFELEGVEVTYLNSSHIVGSASIFIKTDQGSYLFTGDIGTELQKLMEYPPRIPKESVDYLIIESTYADKAHDRDDRERLRGLIEDTCKAGGKVLIPVFAIGRLQEVLHAIKELNLPWKIFVDTPMGQKITMLLNDYSLYLKKQVRREVILGASNIFGDFETVTTNNQSKALALSEEPCIILSSSGMLEGGRVMNHFEIIKGTKKNSIIFVGYQAQGTMGRKVIDRVEPVLCNSYRLSSFSSHADKNELKSYVERLPFVPYKIYIVHGEVMQRMAFQKDLEKMRLRAFTPENSEMSEKSFFVNEKKAKISCPLSFSDFEGYKLAPFAGFLLQKEDRLEIVDRSWMDTLLRKKEEEYSKLQGRVIHEIEAEKEAAVSMTYDELTENIKLLFNVRIYSKKMIETFFTELRERGYTAARQFSVEKHALNPNTEKRRWNEPEGEYTEEEKEKLYLNAYNTLLNAVEVAEHDGINEIYKVFSRYVKRL